MLYIKFCTYYLAQCTHCFYANSNFKIFDPSFDFRMTRACIILLSMQLQIFWLKDDFDHLAFILAARQYSLSRMKIKYSSLPNFWFSFSLLFCQTIWVLNSCLKLPNVQKKINISFKVAEFFLEVILCVWRHENIGMGLRPSITVKGSKHINKVSRRGP